MRTLQKTKEKDFREVDDDLPGYPEYEKEDDIYSKARHEEEIDPEDIRGTKDFSTEDSIEDDLDIPGSELDDDLEEIGEEDEENNYYSLSDNDDLEDLI